MDLLTYVDATAATALYPDANTGTVRALTYLALGLTGEASEVVEKAHTAPADLDALRLELGDVAWYLARLHAEFGFDMLGSISAAGWDDTDHPAPLTDLVITCGRVAELAKKALRDDAGVLTVDRRNALRLALPKVLHAWLEVHLETGLVPGDTCAANIAKLAARQAHGVLAGSGETVADRVARQTTSVHVGARPVSDLRALRY